MVDPRTGRTAPRPAGRQTAAPLALAALALTASWLAPAAAEVPAPVDVVDTRGDAITLELIMSDPDWIGNPPENAYWADGGEAIYFEQKRQGEEHKDLIRLELATGESAVVAEADRGTASVAGGAWSRDRRFKTYSRHGDVYVKDLESASLSQLTRTAEPETEPFFMASGHRVAFTRGAQVFIRDLESGLEYQVADVLLENDPADEETAEDGDPSRKYTDRTHLADQQLRLFDYVRDQKRELERARERERHEQAADPSRPPLPFYLGDEIEIRQTSLSPAGDAMLLVVIDKERDDGRKDQMPAWVTASGYVTSQEVRPKVGTGDGRGERLLFLDLENHEQHEIDLSVLPGIAGDPLAELKRLAREAREKDDGDRHGGDSANGKEEPKDGDDEPEAPSPRAVRFEEPVAWSPDGRQLAVQAHSYDNKDRWLALLDLEERVLRPVHHLSHEAWINWFYNDFGWLADGRRLYFLSEASGYSQLYLHSLDGGTTRRLTRGDYVVSDVVLDPEERYFYYTANPRHPGIYETFRVAIESGRIEQLTDLGGRSSSVLSPDGGQLLITHSAAVRPPELYLQPARPGAAARRITHTVSERFTTLPWVEPEIVAVPSTHHARPIYSRYYPPSPRRGAIGTQGDAPAGRPAVVFVHGAGYLQNAHHGWSGYFREFMFHTLLARRGYAVLDMDYRASAGYGVEWRTAIYRQMGTPELEDLADGVAWLASEHGVDRDRVGVYGGSYGGFLTMMALFKQPDLFACGAALRPVTDWAHYNHPYTSNILNTPDVDPEAYRRSSPIELAAGLENPLLICAPMQDDNVLFADTVRLAQRLIELEKQDWEVAIYPVEPHGFRQPSSWLDEYRRIFKLFETHLKP